jgi:hypothetical protein
MSFWGELPDVATCHAPDTITFTSIRCHYHPMTDANLKALHPHNNFCFKVASSKDLDVTATTTTNDFPLSWFLTIWCYLIYTW